MGVNYTINHLQEKYLVIHVREEVKRVNRECRECARRFKVQPIQQQMAPLPQIRLQMTTKPLANCAVDFGGLYLTIQGRERSHVFVLVLANPLLSFGDGNFTGDRCISQHICANDGKKGMAYENAE